MPRRLSQVLDVEPKQLTKRGVFNGFVDLDSKLYVDPFLLREAETAEFRGSYDGYKAHFVKVLRLLKQSKGDDVLFRQAKKLLTFKESKLVALGYSQAGVAGNGIGPELAGRLARTAKEIVDAGIEDPAIFDLAGLFEESIGADRISDMTTRIIMPRLYRFSVRIARELRLKTVKSSFGGKTYRLPKDSKTGTGLLLLPSELLQTLPVANSWSEIDTVASENAELRGRVNSVIGRTWKQATRNIRKAELRATLLRYPDLIRELLTKYAKKKGRPYDFLRDPEGLITWSDIGPQFAGKYPMALALATPADILKVVIAICNQFGRLIETNGLSKMLYVRGKLRNEQFAQLLFFAVADSYCEANNLALAREPNAGRGPVDFKIASNYKNSVSVEVKYTSNKNLVRGFTTQLPIYAKGERSANSVYLILRTTASESGIKQVKTTRDAAVRSGKRVPDVLVFDARLGPSASKAK